MIDNHVLKPRSDILATKLGYKMLLEMPGVKKSEIKIEHLGNSLYIHAERPDPLKVEEERTYQNILYGDIKSKWQIPSDIDTSNITASYIDGILTVYLPRKTPTKVGITVH